MTGPGTPSSLEHVPASQRSALDHLAERVRESPHNLMSPRALEELWTRHIPECVALATRLPDGVREVADVGSGGGFPGLVIAIVRPDVATTLIESTRKKARFLESTARALDLDHVRVVADRVEHLGDTSLTGRFDVVTARAVAPLVRLIPWTLPLLAPGAVLYAVKGEQWREDLEEARQELGADAFRVVACPRPRSASTTLSPRVVMIAAPGGHPHPEEPTS